jgi:hypothetical protein
MNEDRLKFHIEANDYFGTVATVLDLVAHDLRKHSHSHKAGTLLRLRDELLYLQRGYRIEKSRPSPQ